MMATGFFAQQAQARSTTKRLILLYVMAVLSIMTVITIVFHILFIAPRMAQSARDARDANAYGSGYAEAYNPDQMLAADVGVAGVVLIVIVLGTLVRMAQIGGSGESVAILLGGTPVDPATTDPLERRLMNVVEEMAIASGIAVPRVFVLRDEPGINAFAAGLKPGQAVIGITRGTLEQLTRDELQGVVAHEFSHIFNGDMRLNLHLMSVLGGILVLATIGRLLFQFSPRSRSSDRNENGGVIIIFGLALFVLGYIGVFFARLIKAAVSRQREFLADASAVQYTRNPDGIGGALMKIRQFDSSSQIRSAYAEETSHMFFGSALNVSSLFATHPPLEERINHISPRLLKPGGWTPHVASVAITAAGATDDSNSRAGLATDALAALSVATAHVTATPPPKSKAEPSAVSDTHTILSSIGSPQKADVAAARSFLDSLPESIRERTRDRQGAVFLVLSLFLKSADNDSSHDQGHDSIDCSRNDGTPSANETAQASPEQIAILRATLSDTEVQEILDLRSLVATIAETDRLALLALSLPPLRQLTDASKQMLLKVAGDLAHTDGDVDLYEFVALASLEHQLMRDLKARKPRSVMTSQRIANDLSVVLSAVAYAGADDIQTAKSAFDTGAASLNSSVRQTVTFRDLDECKLKTIADAFERLSDLEPTAQMSVIEACVKIILVDGVVTTKESELLRGLCAVLEAPLPALAI